VGALLTQLLDGLLEPLAENRTSPQEAIDMLAGRFAETKGVPAAAAAVADREAAVGISDSQPLLMEGPSVTQWAHRWVAALGIACIESALQQPLQEAA
jgi:hypothetical protein